MRMFFICAQIIKVIFFTKKPMSVIANDNTKTVTFYLDSKIWMQFAFNKPQITFVVDETKFTCTEQQNFGDIVSADMT